MNPTNELSLSIPQETRRSLTRLLPRLQTALATQIAADPQAWEQFTKRLAEHYPALFKLYYDLYSTRYDFFYHLEDLLLSLGRAWFARPEDLRHLDVAREAGPDWLQ